MVLHKGSKAFHQLLTELHTGDRVPRERVCEAAGWAEVSLKTYVNKNKLARFLRELPDGNFLVLRAGPVLSEDEVERALTQVTPMAISLEKGIEIFGEHVQCKLTIELGRGAVGHVWEAERGSDLFAVKILNPRPDLLEPTRLTNVQRRFERESANGSKLRHEHIIKHLDHGWLSKHPFLVMERAARSVGDILATEGARSAAEARSVLLDVIPALSYLHESDCIHRDIKPANLLVTDRGFVLGDLGIVQWSDLNPEFTDAGTITDASVQLGSWFYMAPEQRHNAHDVTPASDIYALGVSLFEMLTNTRGEPAAFAAGEVPPTPSWSAAHSWIVRMTSFRAGKRPPLSEVLDWCKSALL